MRVHDARAEVEARVGDGDAAVVVLDEVQGDDAAVGDVAVRKGAGGVVGAVEAEDGPDEERVASRSSRGGPRGSYPRAHWRELGGRWEGGAVMRGLSEGPATWMVGGSGGVVRGGGDQAVGCASLTRARRCSRLEDSALNMFLH